MLPENHTDILANWTTQFRKGLLELCILNLLASGEQHGYELAKRLTALPGMVITEGTVYPLLSRLKAAGLLDARIEESPAGPPRKYYRITPAGRQLQHHMNLYWLEVAAGIHELLKESKNG